MKTRYLLLAASVALLAVITVSGCGGSGATGGDSSGGSSGSNSLTGTVQAPTIGIFGNVAETPGKSLGAKSLTNTAVANATVCAYNMVSGTKLGCATTDSTGKYTISGLAQSEMVDPNNTAQARIVIEATTSDGEAKIYDYEDVAIETSLSAGTADSATTNAFTLGTLTEIRKADASWVPESGAAPTSFVDRVKGGTFDPGCKAIPYAGLFSDSDVSVSGSGLGGSIGVASDMLKAGLGRTVWKTLGYSQPADFTYDALNNKLTTAQISTWANAVADDLGISASALENGFSAAMSAVSSLETVLGSVLASDVGLSSRSGRTSTLCSLFKTDTVAMANWVDTLVQYSTTSLLEKHWGSASAFSAAAKFIEEVDEDDVWSVYQPEVIIGMLGSGFSADTVTDARVEAGALIMTKGVYTDETDENKKDIGTDLWEFLLNASSTELETMDDNPAFWIGYVLKYHGDLTSSSSYGTLIDHVLDDADDVSTSTCDADPKACVATADAETPTEASVPLINGSYSTTGGAATSNTCATSSITCANGTLTVTQDGQTITCTQAFSGETTHLTGTGTVASSSSWSCTVSRTRDVSGCELTESVAMTGVPSPFSTSNWSVTWTPTSGASPGICASVTASNLGSCTFTCPATATAQ